MSASMVFDVIINLENSNLSSTLHKLVSNSFPVDSPSQQNQ